MGLASAGLMTALPAGSRAAVVHAADANTILLWHLDETAFSTMVGGDTIDASNNHINGDIFDDGLGSALQTVFPSSTTAVAGTAYQFKGLDNDPVQRNELRSSTISTSNWGGGAFTLELWVNIANLSKMAGADNTLGRVLAEQRNAGGTALNWSLGLQADATDASQFQLRFFTNVSGSADTHNTQSLSWQAGTWYYLALVADPSVAGLQAGQSQYTLYRRTLEGALSQVDQFTAATATFSGGGQFRIGGEDSGTETDRDFYGNLDEVHYSNIARPLSYLQNSSAVPEPASLGLLCAGGLLMLRRRRR
jgi:hypothetical protein